MDLRLNLATDKEISSRPAYHPVGLELRESRNEVGSDFARKERHIGVIAYSSSDLF